MQVYDFYYEEISPGISEIKGFFPKMFLGLQTTRNEGGSQPPFDGFNLATHVGDQAESVAANRERLRGLLPTDPVWLEQVHGCDSIVIARNAEGVKWPRDDVMADASITSEPSQPCAVMTADCLPLLVARPLTGQCAAIHAGWKGLAAGVIEKTLQRMLTQQMAGVPFGQPSAASAPDTWYIWLGPAISQRAFEVGPEVREKFVQQDPQSAAAFLPSTRRQGHFMASLSELALLRLQTFESVNPGIELRVAIDRDCVFENPQRFFSFRRNSRTGRMASLIFRRIVQKA
jgi:polyphenol oxidase